MIELILALQTAELPAAVSQRDVETLAHCLTTNAGQAAALCIDASAEVALSRACIESQGAFGDCPEVAASQCANRLQDAGLRIRVFLPYCDLRSLAAFEQLHAEYRARAERETSPQDWAAFLRMEGDIQTALAAEGEPSPDPADPLYGLTTRYVYLQALTQPLYWWPDLQRDLRDASETPVETTER